MNLDLASMENAIGHLQEALDMYDSDLYERMPEHMPQLKRLLRSAAIQAFEYTYELTFKMIRRHLAHSLQNSEMLNSMSFHNIIRKAYGHNIVRSELAVWLEYRRCRGITSHTYDDAKAQAVFEQIPGFLDEARHVLTCLQELNKANDRYN